VFIYSLCAFAAKLYPEVFAVGVTLATVCGCGFGFGCSFTAHGIITVSPIFRSFAVRRRFCLIISSESTLYLFARPRSVSPDFTSCIRPETGGTLIISPG